MHGGDQEQGGVGATPQQEAPVAVVATAVAVATVTAIAATTTAAATQPIAKPSDAAGFAPTAPAPSTRSTAQPL